MHVIVFVFNFLLPIIICKGSYEFLGQIHQGKESTCHSLGTKDVFFSLLRLNMWFLSRLEKKK
jgi:hypothetical protein